MKGKEELSAEERLLQLIQNEGEPTAPRKRKWWRGLYQSLRSTVKGGKSPQGSLPSPSKRSPASVLVRINRTLSLTIGFLLILSVVNTFSFKSDIGLLHGRVVEARPSQEALNLRPPPVEEVLAAMTRRDFFQMQEGAAESKQSAPAPGRQKGSEGVLENIKLVGIAWGVLPEAMIRETKEGRTFFLKEGDQFRGILVKEIRRDRVIVEYDGQTKELL